VNVLTFSSGFGFNGSLTSIALTGLATGMKVLSSITIGFTVLFVIGKYYWPFTLITTFGEVLMSGMTLFLKTA